MGDNSERILSLESQIQHLVDEILTPVLQHRKSLSILEDETPSTSFLNLETAKKGYNEFMIIKKENQHSNQNMEESENKPRYFSVADWKGINDEFHNSFLVKPEIDDIQCHR